MMAEILSQKEINGLIKVVEEEDTSSSSLFSEEKYLYQNNKGELIVGSWKDIHGGAWYIPMFQKENR